MLRLDTQFEIQHLDRARLLKVISVNELIEKGTNGCAGEASFNDLLLWLTLEEVLEQPTLLTLPVAGILLVDGALATDYPGIILTAPKDNRVVQPGDVIALSPASNVVRVLYRRNANSNLLFITDRCNSLCLMCSQPPKDIDDYWHVEENLRLIDLMDKGDEQIGISGGEPTLYADGLLALIKKASEVLPEKSLHILSNGRLLAQAGWLACLNEIQHPRLTWGIPLYADNAADHDHVVQAPGAFSETMKGLYNLARAGQNIEIRIVLSHLTTSRLPELAHFIFRNLPFVQHIAMMGIENTGLAKKNYDVLWIDPLDYQDTLASACHFLDIRGLSVSVYNLPLCVLDPSLKRFYRQSISDWKNLFIDTCQSCTAKHYCAGFFKSHSLRWQSRGIRPLNLNEGINYARSAS
ncbi:His-Xaa-Ser system radical SAM maturase HxsC [Pseudomonas sp. PDM05]|jgi:His-Xaa-Ser system radical SAM maturase HxsC|uniref:His-Xaa-Ser system radical SAM maturase HxsC n=1 Tax=Pseudomonas sp. PDM05 TaxID=2769301 RepID=UPI00178204B4|nr:His-Xaa-Ser system radical SAM maturase HxsC [Pseudomonas sp. PDM05]MBD9460434.1 His-Xaa-Ser system radical SAM maturase HxsC [Pseudomonas sp. PDM05]